MEYKCNICSKNFKTEESLKQHNSMKHTGGSERREKINFRRYFLLIVVGLIIIFSILLINNYRKKPGEYDEFAKCLTTSGAVVYGNDYCSYTNQQLNYFGKSEKYLNYVKCAKNEQLCDSKGIKTTPTWEIKGEMHSQVQTFERLSSLTGCEI